MAGPYPPPAFTALRAAKFAAVLTECGELSLALASLRSSLRERLAPLDELAADLEQAVARAREAVARGDDFEAAFEDLRFLQIVLRREVEDRCAFSPATPGA